MADLINIRPTRDSATSEEMDIASKALGMSRNEMILTAVDLIRGFDVTFYRKLEQYSKRCKVPMSIAVQNTIIKRWAQDSARKNAWENNTQILEEFTQVDVGIIAPKELYEMVYKMAYDEETKNRFDQLQKELDGGIVLQGTEDEFYNNFKPIYSYVSRAEGNSKKETQAFWEGEDGFAEFTKG